MLILSKHSRAWAQFALSLVAAAATCLFLLGIGTITTTSGWYGFLIWNLFLATVPLVLSTRLRSVLQRRRWSDWSAIAWSLAWIVFLPNSFYLVSDYIHLADIAPTDILFMSVVFTSFIFLGMLLGFASVYQVHRELRKRFTALIATSWIGVLFFANACAIYIGRDLRWNSWDVLFSPAGLLFDISERVLRPADYPNMMVTVLLFFALLTSLYGVFWAWAKLLHVGAVGRR